MIDKIALLMEETGCDRGEAELALEMCGFEVEKAVKAIPRLLKNIVVLKGKLVSAPQHQFGLILVVLNLKSQTLLRTRAVLSYNPAVYGVALEKDWFEFEKHLYGCRLWEGSLQTESQEIEVRLANHFRSFAASAAFKAGAAQSGDLLTQELAGVLEPVFHKAPIQLQVRKEILDLGQFQSLRSEPESAQAHRQSPRSRLSASRADEPLLLKITLEQDPAGVLAADLRAGDIVSAQISDPRDIAQYLAKLLGGYSQEGPLAIAAPVEAVETEGARYDAASAASTALIRVRFAVGVCGDASVSQDSRMKVVRNPHQAGTEAVSWWRRFFIRGS